MENITSALVYQSVSPSFNAEVSNQRLECCGGLFACDVMETIPAFFNQAAEGVLEGMFEIAEFERELLPQLRYTISVGDVIAITDDEGVTQHWMVADSGFNRVACTEHYDAPKGDDPHAAPKAFIRVRKAA